MQAGSLFLLNLLNRTLALCAVLISVGWIIGAAYFHMEGTGGRGGAIVVAVSFCFLFTGGELATTVYDFLVKSNSSPEQNIIADVSRLNVAAAVMQQQNRYLAFSSVVGTLAWGFGDIAARYVPNSLLQFILNESSILCPRMGEVCQFVSRFVHL